MPAAPRQLEELLATEIPPQRAFPYPGPRWRAWTGHIEGVGPALAALPSELDRRTVAQQVETLLPTNVAGAFTVAMIWGHGPSGYGPFRTARILTGSRQPLGVAASDQVLKRLELSAEISRQDGPVQGYRYLNARTTRIAWLGPAFFTKWLYFATARGDSNAPAAAPVLDALVIRWLTREAAVSLRPGYTDDYARYVDLLRAWGDPHGLTAVQVEERIFRLLRNDGS